MTSLTVLGRAAIHTNHPAIDFLLLRVTLRAANHAVRAIQRIIGLAVIEGAGAPF